MNILILMVPMSLLLGLGFIGAFFWASSRNQFEDLETPAHRILDDNDERKRL
jgi:cbb3-type cytochrome oxidase maturation protein